MIERKKTYIWIWLGVIALVVRFIFTAFPEFGQVTYRLALYPIIRIGLDNTIGNLPFSGFWVLVLAMCVFLIYYFLIRQRRRATYREIILSTFNVIGFIVFWFLLMWGFHYSLPELKTILALDSDDSTDLETFYRATLTEAEINRSFMLEGPLSDSDLPANYQMEILDEVKEVMDAADFNVASDVMVRETGNGFIRRFSIHGFYLPFTGEGIVDGSLTTIPRIFTLAHEASHGYGITNEGEANFVAYLALKNSEHPALNYIADFVLFRHTLFVISRREPAKFQEFYQEIPKSILTDIQHISADVAKHPEFFPRLSATVNNAYLRTQGIEQGVESYDDLVSLAISWNNQGRILSLRKGSPTSVK